MPSTLDDHLNVLRSTPKRPPQCVIFNSEWPPQCVIFNPEWPPNCDIFNPEWPPNWVTLHSEWPPQWVTINPIEITDYAINEILKQNTNSKPTANYRFYVIFYIQHSFSSDWWKWQNTGFLWGLLSILFFCILHPTDGVCSTEVHIKANHFVTRNQTIFIAE